MEIIKMEKSTMTAVKFGLLFSFLFLNGCAWRTSLCPDLAESRPYSKFDMPIFSPRKSVMYCEVPPVAQEIYREFIIGNVWTRPESYFTNLKKPEPTIRFLAIGDSWFAYPKEWWLFDILKSPSNILTHLGGLKFEGYEPRILSLSNSGEIVTNMAGIADEDHRDLPQRAHTDHRIPWVITRALRSAKEQNKPFNYILISGGGNDLYPDRIKLMLNKNPDISFPVPERYINQEELTKFIERFGKAYEKLIEHIQSQPGYENTKIIAHTYDRIIPMPIGAAFANGLFSVGRYGWIYPVLEEYNINDREHQQKISTFVLEKMKEKLESIASHKKYKKNFLVVNTQGVLEHVHKSKNPGKPFPIEDYWLNEIHPTPKGFKYIAREIHGAIVDDIRTVEKQVTIHNKDCAKMVC